MKWGCSSATIQTLWNRILNVRNKHLLQRTKTQSEVDLTVFFCENTYCYSAANKMWKYDVRDVLVAWRAPPLPKWARSGRFLNTHTHTDARTYTHARARILWTATCGFLLDSCTQPVGVSDHQWDHFSCYGVAFSSAQRLEILVFGEQTCPLM